MTQTWRIHLNRARSKFAGQPQTILNELEADAHRRGFGGAIAANALPSIHNAAKSVVDELVGECEKEANELVKVGKSDAALRALSQERLDSIYELIREWFQHLPNKLNSEREQLDHRVLTLQQYAREEFALKSEALTRLHFPSKVEAMGQLADSQRDFEVFVESARNETSSPSFMEWAGGERVMLAIVFTDLVGATAMGNEVGDEQMNEVSEAHFAQGRKLLGPHEGREIKTIGDAFMAAFHSVDAALDFALALQSNPGHPQIQVRAGIHSGAMQVKENDVKGLTVNFAARVVQAITGAEIWLSDRAKEDIDNLRAKRHSTLKWKQHDAVAMKGFPDTVTLWSLVK